MKLTSTYRKQQTELLHEKARINKTDNGVNIRQNRHQNDREKFYTLELSRTEVLELIEVSGYKLMPEWMVKVMGWFK